MATRRNIEVVITVRDAASKPLDEVQRKLRGAGSAAAQASLDFKQFNKTLFATTAFIGTFLKAFTAIKSSLDMGGDLDRLSDQYERVLGPKGKLFDSISTLTTTSISRMEAMRAGLQLSSLGITKDVGQAADVIAKAGTAAKLAGLDSAEGVQKFTEFLKSGNVGSLEFLNLISRTNPALQAQMAILQKAGGVMGTVISTQAKLNMGMAILDAATRGNLNSMRDLKDVMISFGDSWDWLRRQIGRFLGAALGPLIEKLSPFLYKLGDAIDRIRRTEKTLVFLAKAIIITTGALVGLAGALGSINLMVKLLGFAGIGLPGLSTALLIVTGLFVGLTDSADSVIDRFKLFGGFIQGIWQLITSLDTETGFAKMDKSIHDMLKKAGLLTLAQNIARVGSVVKTVVEDSVEAFKQMAYWMDKTFGGVFKTITGFLDNFSSAWNIWWVSGSITPLEKFKRAATTILLSLGAIWAGSKVFKIIGSVFSKIPVIGKLFGGGDGTKPKGTASDPIYTKSVNGGILTGADQFTDLITGKKGKGIFGDILSTLGSSLYKMLSGLLAGLVSVLPLILAGAIGLGVGKLTQVGLDNLTGGKYSSIVGAPGAWLADKTGAGMSDEEAFKLAEQKYGKKRDKKTEVSVPMMPDSQIEVVDALGEQMKKLEGDKRAKFKESFESALASGSAGGSQITSDEFRDAMLMALDNSENLSTLADKAKESKSTISPSSRRQQTP